MVAIEYSPVSFLSFSTPPGLKMILTDAILINGALLLTPQNVQLLGGEDPSLVAALKAVVETCNATAQPYKNRGGNATESVLTRASIAASAEYTKSMQALAQQLTSDSPELASTDARVPASRSTGMAACGGHMVSCSEQTDYMRLSKECLNGSIKALQHTLYQNEPANTTGNSIDQSQSVSRETPVTPFRCGPVNSGNSPHTPAQATRKGCSKPAQTSTLKRLYAKQQPVAITPFLSAREVLSETAVNAVDSSNRIEPCVDESPCFSSPCESNGNQDVIDLCKSPIAVKTQASSENTYAGRRLRFKRLRRAKSPLAAEEGLDSAIELYDNDLDDYLVDLTAAE